MEPETA